VILKEREAAVICLKDSESDEHVSEDEVVITDEIEYKVDIKCELYDITMTEKVSTRDTCLTCSLCSSSAVSSSDLVRHLVPCTLKHVRIAHLKESAKNKSVNYKSEVSQALNSEDKCKNIAIHSGAKLNMFVDNRCAQCNITSRYSFCPDRHVTKVFCNFCGVLCLLTQPEVYLKDNYICEHCDDFATANKSDMDRHNRELHSNIK
jgi:hypothetical protein